MRQVTKVRYDVYNTYEAFLAYPFLRYIELPMYMEQSD